MSSSDQVSPSLLRQAQRVTQLWRAKQRSGGILREDLEAAINKLCETTEGLEAREETQQKRADLERIIDDVELALDPEYGFNNDEVLRLGIGYGIPGPLSDEQVRSEAAEILSELEAS